MLINDPEAFNRKARQWAIMYANAPQNGSFQSVTPRSTINPQALIDDDSKYDALTPDVLLVMSSTVFSDIVILTRVFPCRYQGYNKDLVNQFVDMGFDIDRVVEALQFVGIDTDTVRLGPEYIGDITARILGEM